MKKNLLTLSLLAIISFFLVSCCTVPPAQNAAPTFAPYKFNADNYAPKVDNFVIIMDNSTSMTENYGDKIKLDISKDLLSAVNESLPELNYKAQLITFGPKNRVYNDFGPATYSTAGLGGAIAAVKNPSGGSNVPLANALQAAGESLKSSQGTIAVIVLADGDLMNKVPVNAAAALKKQYGDRLCIYTILLGDSPAGKKVLAQIASAGACGSATNVDDLAASGKVAAFVEGIFLTKKSAPAPKPVAAAAQADSDGDGVPDSIDQCPNTPYGATVDARGCWTYDATVLFGFDSTEIDPQAFNMLDEAVVVMGKNSDLKVEINGHTDSTGSAEYNLGLSERRANTVMKYFVDKGIDASRLTAKGFGLTQPVADNGTKEGRAKNRRVELKPVK
jgi:OOP family OmpA-OmpF porin